MGCIVRDVEHRTTVFTAVAEPQYFNTNAGGVRDTSTYLQARHLRPLVGRVRGS